MEYSAIIAENIGEYTSNPSEWSDLQKRCWNEAMFELYDASALGIRIELFGVQMILSKNYDIDEERFPEMVFQLDIFTINNLPHYKAMWQKISESTYSLLLKYMIDKERLHVGTTDKVKATILRICRLVFSFLTGRDQGRR